MNAIETKLYEIIKQFFVFWTIVSYRSDDDVVISSSSNDIFFPTYFSISELRFAVTNQW
jgi:hypothetical protein